ncbi:MAG: tetratricopeptide repeat protein, partial [Gemmatimonadota bacterium]|nr:tetratricopeptide repeat protein [Gemmatimonadota bacterium]
QDRMLDSLLHTQQAIHAFRSATVADLAEIARQLVQIQELTGQSQQRLSELRSDLEARIQASLLGGPPVAGGAVNDTSAAPLLPMPSANQMYQAAIMQFRRGSLGTARFGFQDFLRAWPADVQVPDALYHIGETWATENPDSAIAYHSQVVDRFRTSPRAPTSLYKIGQAAEARNDPRAARAAYERLIREYPRAADVPLAQDRLNALRP